MAFVNRRKQAPLETTDEKLVEAREMADAGLRLVLPQLFEQVEEAPDTPEPVAHEDATVIGTELLAIKESVTRMGVRLPLEGYKDLHLAFNGLLNEVDRIGAVLAERWGDQ